MSNKLLKKFYLFLKVIRINRTFLTSFEFILWYILSIYILNINFDIIIFMKNVFVYFVLFWLIYPIVYIYNDICDVEKDKKNKDKLKYKPLASNQISLEKFLWYWIFSIWLWLILSFWASKIFILFFWFAILFNYFYTNYLKHIFIIENFANAFTHSFIRFWLWLILPFYSIIQGTINIHDLQEIANWYNYYILLFLLLIFSHFIYWSLWSLYKRYIEFKINTASRTTLKKYNKSIFKKLIIFFNILYFLLFFVILFYTQYNIILNWILLMWIFIINLSIFFWKNKYLDFFLKNIILW